MTNSTQTSRVDLYQKVTDEILAYLEAGVRPWSQSWQSGAAMGLPLRATGEPYRGVNVLILWAAQMKRGFRAARWMTFKQARALGANVRKGEKGQYVLYFSTLERPQADDSAETARVPFLKQYCVFNLEQIENLPADLAASLTVDKTDPGAEAVNPETANPADRALLSCGADVVHGGNSAYYMPGEDRITMPAFEEFRDADAYTTTLAHELIHWTGSDGRLARDFRAQNGIADIALEELVAELGAAFVCASLGVATKERRDHADYIGHWIKALKDDKRAIIRAAAKAQAATDYLRGLIGEAGQ